MTTQIDKLTRNAPLPAWAEEAARMEAEEGLTLTEIAERVKIGRQQLSLYRNHHPKYLEVRTATAEKMLEPQRLQKQLVQTETLSSIRKAIRILSQGMDAEIDGIPAWGLRMEAARIVLSSPITKEMFGGLVEAEIKSGASALAAVQIVFTKEDEVEIRKLEGYIEDGEIVEEEDARG